MHDAEAHAFAAHAPADLGLQTEALRETLTTLAPHLHRHGRAAEAHADELDGE